MQFWHFKSFSSIMFYAFQSYLMTNLLDFWIYWNVYNIYTLIYVFRGYTQLYQQYVFRDHFSSLGSYKVCLYENMIERLCNGIIINKYL